MWIWRLGFRQSHPLRADPKGNREMRRLPTLAEDLTRALLADRLDRLFPPEKLLKGNAFAGVLFDPLRNGLLMERLEYDLLFRWFSVGIGPSTIRPGTIRIFTKNRDRLLEGDIAAQVPGRSPGPAPRVKRLLSSDHFSVRQHTD